MLFRSLHKHYGQSFQIFNNFDFKYLFIDGCVTCLPNASKLLSKSYCVRSVQLKNNIICDTMYNKVCHCNNFVVSSSQKVQHTAISEGDEDEILQLQLLVLLFVNFHFVVPHKAKIANQDG